MQKLEEHDKLFDLLTSKALEHSKFLDMLTSKSLEHDKLLDLLAHKALEHDDRFESIETNIAGLATKVEINKIIITLDTLVGMYKTNEQDRAMIAHGLRKTEDRVEILEKDVAKMKPVLGLS